MLFIYLFVLVQLIGMGLDVQDGSTDIALMSNESVQINYDNETNISIDKDKEKEKVKKEFIIYNNKYSNENMNKIFMKHEQFDGVMLKYWKQRHRLFKKYDEGIILTKELWFSVTPESISKFTALLIKYCIGEIDDRPTRVVDAFAGGGGNVIQFLKYFDEVFAVDINHIHLFCTKHNAQVYFGDNKRDNLKLLPLNWMYYITENDECKVVGDDHMNNVDDDLGDGYNIDTEIHNVRRLYANKEESKNSLEQMEDVKIDCIFGSPPWGGPEYINVETYNLNNLLPFSLETLILQLRKYTENICLFLPKNSDLYYIQKLTRNYYPNENYVRVFRTISLNRAKGLLVCWGPIFSDLNVNKFVKYAKEVYPDINIV